MKSRFWLGLLLGSCCLPALAGSAVFVAAAGLHVRPAPHAPVKAGVAAGTKADILRGKGYWVEVDTARGRGWVKLSALRLPADTIQAGASPLYGLDSGRVVAGGAP